MNYARRWMVGIPLWLLTTTGCPVDDPATREQKREDRLLQEASAVYDQDRASYLALIQQIDSPDRRDLLRLRLAMEKPERGQRLCPEVETEGARHKCEQVLSRPHLYRQPAGTP